MYSPQITGRFSKKHLAWLRKDIAPVSQKLINHLFAKGIDPDGVSVIDKFNKGTPRAIERGKAFTLDGINGIVTIGNVGNIQYFHARIKLAVDDQVITTLQNSTATAISVVAGVLTFGASLTVNNIYIDGVSKTAAQVGVLLNDNAEHNLHIDFDQIAASNLILGTDSSAFGNFAMFDVRVSDAVEPVADVLLVYTNPNLLFGTETHSWHLDEGLGADALNNIDQTKPGAITGGVTYTIQDIVSWQDEVGYTLSDGATYYKESALTNLIANGVFIPKVNGQNKCAAYVTGGVLGDLQYSGKAPKPGKLVQSNCVTLDGVNDFVNIDDVLTNVLATTTKGTWACWVKPVDATPSTFGEFISFGDTSAETYIGIVIKSTTGKFEVLIRKISGFQLRLETDVSPFSDNTWTHVAVVQSGIEPVLYVDGVKPSQTFSTSADKTTWFNDSTDLDNGRIGALKFAGGGELNEFNGQMCGVNFWNTDLSAAEIAIVAANGTVKAANLVAEFPLAEENGLTVFDASPNGNHGTASGMLSSELWANTQDFYHRNIKGFERYTDDATGLLTTRVPFKDDGTKITPTIAGYTKQGDHPAHKGHNGAETKFKCNSNDDPMIIYQGNGDTSSTVHAITDVLMPPEYINYQGEVTRYKDFLHYKDTLTQAERDKILSYVKDTWELSDLGSKLKLDLDGKDTKYLALMVGNDVMTLFNRIGSRVNFDSPDFSDQSAWQNVEGVWSWDGNGYLRADADGTTDYCSPEIGGLIDNANFKGEAWRIKIKINSTNADNTALAGIRVNQNSAKTFTTLGLNFTVGTDQVSDWVQSLGENGRLRILFNHAASYFIVFEYFEIEWYDGENANFTPASAQPPWDTVDLISADGVADFGNLDPLVSKISADTAGSIFCVFKTPAVLTSDVYLFTVEDESSNGEYFIAALRTISSKLYIGMWSVTAGPSDNISFYGDTELAINTVYLGVWSNDGSNFSLRVNGLEETLTFTGSADQGRWLSGHANLDISRLAVLNSGGASVYTKANYKKLVYMNTKYTTTERGRIENKLNHRFGIY